MHLFKQKINWQAVIGQVGLLLHVPAAMATLSLGICLIFKEWFALIPFASLAVFCFAIGQILLYATKRAKASHLWDAMIIAALGWLICSTLAAIPIYWISCVLLKHGIESPILQIFSHPMNALFESFSGFTSTGLTMLQQEGFFPYALQWWRSFLEWVGGLGLVVFVLALTHLNKQGYHLYYAEARSDQMAKNITQTALDIWGIYSLFTCIGFFLFLAAGMPLWEAINHAMTVISTGGFTITPINFQGYGPSIQIIAIFMMMIGAISFSIHYRVIRERDFWILWKNMQHRLLYMFIICGGVLVLLTNLWNGLKGYYLESFFEWTSALTTCGFNAMNLDLFSPMVKILLIIGMFIGGATGSTVGGIKIHRLMYLFSGITLRLLALTTKKEKYITRKYNSGRKRLEEPAGLDLPHSQKTGRLLTANILFSLWTSTLFLGWFFILKWVPKEKALDALFEVTSAMSNVGLSSGIVSPDLPISAKWIFIFLMWIGRLEIIPALVLLLTLPLLFKRSPKNGKQS